MSTHNIDFYEDLTKIIFELHMYHQISSNMHLISSAGQFCRKGFCLASHGKPLEAKQLKKKKLSM